MLRIVGMFALGGIFGWINIDEHKAVKLVQIGVGAPALAATFVFGHADKSDQLRTGSIDFSSFFMSEAYAQSSSPVQSKPNGAFQQILDGFTGNYGKQIDSTENNRPISNHDLPPRAWVDARGGNIPVAALAVGNETIDKNSLSLYACRANYEGGMHPGKIRKGLLGCDIAFGSREQQVETYQVLVSLSDVSYTWISDTNGKIPSGAVKGGVDIPPGKEDLFICRAKFEDKDGIHPGKIRGNFGGCSVSWGGRSAITKKYDVLVQRD
ncbi:hypothetical protein GCM10011396_35080 [Undibacterium terreum]|uniref:Uncharacterized protein n=2 Tax=Undibacterium terreum TaxID=1224302 RepID=A0A916XMP3_9BURK|nr:hypothetical protein GCM10011396_35080 [Undibacterium terreum]